MNQKIQYLREKLKLKNIDGMIISNPNNILYLTNLHAEGMLLLTKKENIFLTDSRYIEDANNTITISDEVIIANVRDYIPDDYENFFMFCENVGIEENHLTYAQYQNIQYTYKCNNLVETENVIEKIRAIKDEEEIENIRKACEITDKCFEHLLTFIKKGKKEKDIGFEIESFFRKNGAEDVAFKPIVASRTKFFKTTCNDNK